LARITDVDFDLTFDPPLNPGKPVVDDDEPSGTARVALRKLGERMEYDWSDFKRVDAYRSDGTKSKK
ncbi:MAG: hypothetical protein ABIQ12_12255, partial [Opitutaceae bacterium]